MVDRAETPQELPAQMAEDVPIVMLILRAGSGHIRIRPEREWDPPVVETGSEPTG
jgi:hypothetical protein